MSKFERSTWSLIFCHGRGGLDEKCYNDYINFYKYDNSLTCFKLGIMQWSNMAYHVLFRSGVYS